MIALAAKGKAEVDRITSWRCRLAAAAKALPGRAASGFYAAYFRDPEGNKLNAFVMG